MERSCVQWSLLLLVCLAVGGGIARAQVANPQILDAYGKIDPARIDADARILTGVDPYHGEYILSRDIDHPDHDKALDFLQDRLTEIGLPFEVETYDCRTDLSCSNLYVEIAGETDPGAIWMVGAHLDSTQDPDYAPGAVDNASGVIIVLEALRVLSDYTFAQTLRFILFDSEESGHMGSRVHAEASFNRQDEIRNLLNLDLPGWRLEGINAALSSSNYPSWPDLQVMNQLAHVYPAGTAHVGVVWPGNDSSDHASFWDFGYHAYILGSAYQLSGFMHWDDTYERLDLEQCNNVARLVVAYLGEQAGILGEPADDDDNDDNDDNDNNDNNDDDAVDDDDDDDINDDDNDESPSDDDDDDDDEDACSC